MAECPRTNRRRVFILGAGFSRPAGLPLGNELFKDVLSGFRKKFSAPSRLDRDIERYIAYKRLTEGIDLSEETIEMEAFVSFLDIEHALRIDGIGETLSRDGNASQLIIRRHIAETLFFRQEAMPESVIPLYESFVAGLEPADTLITFNYDTLLEIFLERAGKKFRLFPDRLDKNLERDLSEIVILKLHGSIDWFDKSTHNELTASSRGHGEVTEPHWSIFTKPNNLGLQPLTDDGRDEDHPFGTIYRMKNLKTFFQNWVSGTNPPLIVSPSYSKMLYLNPLRGLWDGVARHGLLNSSLAVIGYSVPAHDEYLRQVLYSIITLFQGSDYALGNRTKQPLVIVQRPSNNKEEADLLNAYRFANLSKTVFDWEGLRLEVLPTLFMP